MEFPLYLLVAAVVISFYTSFMGGANDFANAFGTSVGSRAITIRQAVFIAIFAELIGAVLVGGHVTDTVRKGIVDPSGYADEPIRLIFGLLAALVGSGLFLQAATHFGLPVSTTHAIVGALLGFGITSRGFGGIDWVTILNIVLSWVLSPIGGGIAAFFTFRLIQKKVLEKPKPLAAARGVLPVYMGLTAGIIFLSLVYKGLKNLHLDLPLVQALPLAVLIGVVAALIIRARLGNKDWGEPHPRQLEIVERRFMYLQVMTAAYVAFAHGANDVANGIGPLAGIWTIYHQGLVGLKAQVPVWILLLGGVGIVLGLAVYGHRVIDTVGKRITFITPSRGFAAEFSAATVVLVFSKLGMPVSTTHTLVGAVIGVGFAHGLGAIDLRVVRNILTSWLVTIPLAAVASALTYIVLLQLFR